MKNIFFVGLLSFLCSSYANAEITTKKQADQFITKYCISLVNDLEIALKISEQIKGKDEFLEFLAIGSETKQIIDTYTKLCK